MAVNSLRRSIVLVLATLAASVLPVALPVLAAPSHKPCNHPDSAFVWTEDREAQDQVFSGHDGHIGPPTPEDWARYQAAEAKLNAARSLFPCPQSQDSHRRHRH